MSTATLTPRPFRALALLHARFQFLETVRVPIAVLGNLLFPSLAMLFFVVPQRSVADDPLAATAAIAQLGVFAVMSTCLFSFGVGVSEDRAMPFDPFLRTLPAGAGPRLAGRVLNGVIWSYLALVPLVVLGVLLTAATLSLTQALAAVALVPAVAVPFLLLGLAIGYRLSSKASIAVVQATLFPLAFAGGLFLPPQAFPGWLDTLSTFLPSRAARDLAVQVVTGESAYAYALPVILAWTVLFAALAVIAYRNDEGRRFH
ncbi:ABC transporter permease [Cellulomonas fengjieae]|uniref:ABC transporter permease n=1 Tax=Cellulomonas fengjieae TaxID=2819978 RepID=A0ABS3SK35_9CELL|nr:ABC transporter permease [Cellulomonas fengjieae]MBO3086111.1 ABC transporter permease [Cellulomonas fengjieae]MBO3102485.1 ABC transporter permease [Cellulomonas fengjieae]QVI65826.1 ABC transporter permease [Cellulomonas fengjieae]